MLTTEHYLTIILVINLYANNINISGTTTPELYEREQQISGFQRYHKLDLEDIEIVMELLVFVKKEKEKRAAQETRDTRKEQEIKEEKRALKEDLKERIERVKTLGALQ